MAGKIKGITIELGADTKKFESGIKSAAGQSKKLNDELRDVQRALKLDPKNTELLAQKQRLLADSIDHTKDTLNALKRAKEDADRTIAAGGKVTEEQYRKLQREIVETESKLKGLEKSQNGVNAMLKDMGAGFDKVGDKATRAGKEMMTVSVGTAAAGIAAVNLSLAFDDAMAKVSTIADETAVPLDALKAQIVEASSATGVAAEQIAEDVYNAISAGQKTEDAVDFVMGANKLAQAGFADQAAALDVLTTTLNAYGLSADEAARVMDVLVQTQNKGKTTVGDLAGVLGKIIPTAKSSNLSLEQLGASYALLTSNGIATAEATTYANGLLNELAKSGSKSSDMLKEKTGKSFQELMASGSSLSEVLILLEDEAKKSGLALADMFGSSEAAKAANVLITDQGKAFDDLLTSMENAGGATEDAFQKVQTDSKKVKKSLNDIRNAGMEVGDSLDPIFQTVADITKSVSEFLKGLSDDEIKFIGTLLLIITAIGPVLLVVGKLATGIGALITFFAAGGAGATALAGAIAFITGPIGLTIAAIAAAIAIGVALVENWDEIKKFAGELWTNVSEGFSEMVDNVVEWFDDLIAEGAELYESFKDIGADLVEGFWEGIESMGKWLKDNVGGFFGGIADKVKGYFGTESPYGKFADVDDYKGKGLAEGIKSTMRTIPGAPKLPGQLGFAGASAGGSVTHSGVIRVEGVNDRNQLIGVSDIIIDQLRREARRR